MTRLVSAIPVIAEQTGRAVVIVGGVAVMCRLSTPYRATTDLDTVNRRAVDERSQLELLVSAGATPSGPSGAVVHTPYGAVQVDVLEVTDAEVDDLPDDPTDRLHVQSHAWAASTASDLQLNADELQTMTVRVAEPGPLIAMKLQALMNRGSAKEGTDLLDIVRITLDRHLRARVAGPTGDRRPWPVRRCAASRATMVRRSRAPLVGEDSSCTRRR